VVTSNDIGDVRFKFMSRTKVINQRGNCGKVGSTKYEALSYSFRKIIVDHIFCLSESISSFSTERSVNTLLSLYIGILISDTALSLAWDLASW
jgi:hypothetical protein